MLPVTTPIIDVHFDPTELGHSTLLDFISYYQILFTVCLEYETVERFLQIVGQSQRSLHGNSVQRQQSQYSGR